MKKIVLLLVLSVLFFAASCSSDITEEFNGDLNESEGISSLSGLTFNWGTPYKTQFMPEVGFSADGDMMLARYADIRAQGCNFDIISWGENTSSFIQNIAAQLTVPDIMDTNSYIATQLNALNLLYSLEEIQTIDYTDEKWGNKNYIAFGKLDGVQYGFTQYMWCFPPEINGTFFFNNKLVKQYGGQSPYEMQEAGNWNWENFEEWAMGLSKNSDGIRAISSIASYADDSINFILSNNVPAVVDINGTLKFNWNCQAAIDALEFGARLVSEGLMRPGNKEGFTEGKSFSTIGNSSFGTHHNEVGGYFTTAMDEFGIMPLPYGPNATKDTVSALALAYLRLQFVINSPDNDADEIGTVLDYLFAPLEEGTTEPGWKEYVKSNTLFHIEDYNNYVYMIEHAAYDYSTEMTQTTYDLLRNSFGKVIDGYFTAAQAIENVERSVNNALSK